MIAAKVHRGTAIALWGFSQVAARFLGGAAELRQVVLLMLPPSTLLSGCKRGETTTVVRAGFTTTTSAAAAAAAAALVPLAPPTLDRLSRCLFTTFFHPLATINHSSSTANIASAIAADNTSPCSFTPPTSTPPTQPQPPCQPVFADSIDLSSFQHILLCTSRTQHQKHNTTHTLFYKQTNHVCSLSLSLARISSSNVYHIACSFWLQ